jgi:hypothetical protein
MADLSVDEITAAAVTYRVATIGFERGDLWRVRPKEFATRELAEEWAHTVLWMDCSGGDGEERPRNAYVLPAVEGYVVVPGWMAERMWPLEQAPQTGIPQGEDECNPDTTASKLQGNL